MPRLMLGLNEVYGIRDQQRFYGWDQGSQHRDLLGSQPVGPGSGSAVFSWFRDQNSQCFGNRVSKFSTFLRSGIKISGTNTESVMQKYTSLRPCGRVQSCVLWSYTMHEFRNQNISIG